MKWILLAVAVTTLTVGCSAVGQHARAATASEQDAILVAAITHQRPNASIGREPQPLTLDDSTVSICSERRRDRPCSELVPWSEDDLANGRHAGSLVDADQARALVATLRSVNVGRKSLAHLRKAPFTDNERIAALTKPTGDWQKSSSAKPRTAGILRVSLPVVSAKGDLALVYVETYAPTSGTAGQMELFAIRGGQWHFAGALGYTLQVFECPLVYPSS